MQLHASKYVLVMNPFISDPDLRQVWAIATYTSNGELKILQSRSPLSSKQKDWLKKEKHGATKLFITLLDENRHLIDTQQQEVSMFIEI